MISLEWSDRSIALVLSCPYLYAELLALPLNFNLISFHGISMFGEMSLPPDFQVQANTASESSVMPPSMSTVVRLGMHVGV